MVTNRTFGMCDGCVHQWVKSKQQNLNYRPVLSNPHILVSRQQIDPTFIPSQCLTQFDLWQTLSWCSPNNAIVKNVHDNRTHWYSSPSSTIEKRDIVDSRCAGWILSGQTRPIKLLELLVALFVSRVPSAIPPYLEAIGVYGTKIVVAGGRSWSDDLVNATFTRSTTLYGSSRR
ncbi:hypothetical protein BJ742DRAFT_866310 [Cladochytrium replicatum]|nr:hypothetical protein BJ742DRAFT_866310 [Cladochytrium replicatum]